MFRRRAVIGPRRLLRRPRLLGAAVVGGLGFAAGRASRRPPVPTSDSSNPVAGALVLPDKLKALADMHAAGTLSDEEFTLAKRRLLGSPTH